MIRNVSCEKQSGMGMAFIRFSMGTAQVSSLQGPSPRNCRNTSTRWPTPSAFGGRGALSLSDIGDFISFGTW